eukprot:1587661-Amphidinium_carterae.1
MASSGLLFFKFIRRTAIFHPSWSLASTLLHYLPPTFSTCLLNEQVKAQSCTAHAKHATTCPAMLLSRTMLSFAPTSS